MATPSKGADLERAGWVIARMKELPKYCMFLYNVLLDSRLSWDMKEHAFGTLHYVFEESDIIADSDPLLGRLDDLTMVFRCFTELIARLPAGTLAIYEEVLARDRIPIRAYIIEAPLWLDNFYVAIASLYRGKIDAHKQYLGNAIKTGALVKGMQAYLAHEQQHPQTFSPDRLNAIEAFLKSFSNPDKSGAPAGAAIPATSGGMPAKQVS